MAKVGFIGLGVMGFPMAAHLGRAGHEVTVYNRTIAKVQQWLNQDGLGHCAGAPSPAAAAEDADIVITCVGADPDVEAVVLGPDGALDSMKAGAVLIDHTTSSARLARRLAEEAGSRQVGFLDAPVSGGQAGAENAALTIMVGGSEADYAKAEDILSVYGPSRALIGAAGAGQLAKMVNQICIAGLVQALSEGLHFGQQSGLDMDKVLSVIAKGAAGSWQMNNRAQTMLAGEFDFGFAVDWMRKDLKMCLDEAGDLGIGLPVTALVDQFYAEVQGMGGNRWDTSSLIARFQEKS